MIRKGISGGLLSVKSLLDSKDRQSMSNQAMVRTSSSLREAAKIGLQTLYTNADEVLERYKDFDLIKEMKSRKNSNLLWVRARAIDADVVNTNGDYFSEEELLKENDYQGKKLPAYKTFEGVPIYTNHKNDNIEEAKGMVVYAEWDDEEKCVYCVFFVDEDAYPDIARGIRHGYIRDVSMGCSVDLGECSICGNKATTEKEYCDCLKKYKGKMHPSGKRTFEYNFGIKFIELSCVGDGAFESCEILELYDSEDFLKKAETTIKSARSLNSSITIAASLHNDISTQKEVEKTLRQLQSLNSSIIRVAQSAGTLVGGQIAGGNAIQNATVVKILQGLGIDPSGQLNILDLINLALNFLEVAVLNLFSRKENIDLVHVAKITKAMGELQNTLQDMIDDGIDSSGGSAAAGQPMITPQAPAQPPANQGATAEQALPAQGIGAQAQMPASLEQPSVGQLISPFSQQPYVMPLGGGVSANTSNTRFVWASDQTEEVNVQTKKLNKISKVIVAIDNLREACGIQTKNYEGDLLSSQKNIQTVSGGDKNIMDQFAKIAQDYKKQNSVALGIDIKLDDNHGNRVVLSTDKGIKGFYKGQLTNWQPNLNDTQLSQMENGSGYKVAGELLQEFSKTMKTAEVQNKVNDMLTLDENLESEKEFDLVRLTTEVNKEHAGVTDETFQAKLEEQRKNAPQTHSYNEMIQSLRHEDLVYIVTELSKDAKKGLGTKTLQEMLHPDLSRSEVSGREVMCNVIDGIIKTCTRTKSSPRTVLSALLTLSANQDFPKVLKLASLGTGTREYSSLMTKFAQAEKEGQPLPDPMVPEEPMMDEEHPSDLGLEAMKDVADEATPGTSEGDIMEAFTVIKDNLQKVVEKLDDILERNAPKDTKKEEMESVLDEEVEEPTDNEAMKGAVTGLSLAGEDAGVSPEDMVGAVNEMAPEDMASEIDMQRTPSLATARSRDRRTATASKNQLRSVIIGWLADVANQNNLSTERIVIASKLFCSYPDAAKNVLSKSMRTAAVRVTDITSHETTICATVEDLGFDVKDAAFNQKFRDFAVDLLSQSGYEIDPTTFALTEINVEDNGMVTGKVSTKATKSFSPEMMKEDSYVDEDRVKAEIPEITGMPEIEGMSDIPMPIDPSAQAMSMGPIDNMPKSLEETPSIVMTASAKSMRRMARLQNIIKVAQGLGLPGAAPGAPGAAGAAPGAMDPLLGGAPDAGMAGGAADLGLSSLTGSTPGMDDDAALDAQSEPGTKSPWGTICPQCGSKDVDIANGEGECNSCDTQLKYKFIVEAVPSGKGDKEESEAGGLDAATAAMPLPPTGGIGAPLATAETGMATPGAGAPGMGAPGMGAPGMGMAGMGAPGMGAMASTGKVMVKVAYRTTADVYANALSEGFDKRTAHKLPVGMICPSCGSRTASKQEKNTYCYDCGTISVTEVKKVPGKPGEIDTSIVWI